MSDTPIKPGWQTSEFWLSALAAIVGLLLASGLVPEGGLGARIVGAIMTALGAMGYSVSRGIAKGGAEIGRSLRR